MRNRFSATFILAIFFYLSNSHFSFAAENGVDPREAAIDRVIGGMEEGSRPLEPQSDAGKTRTRPIPGGNLSPLSDTHATASAGPNVGTSSVNTNPGANLGAGAGPGGPTEPSTEPTSGSGGTSDSIINVDANVDLSGGEPAVDANLTVDTNADSLLDADTSATTDVTSVDTTVTEDGTIAGQDLTTTVNEAPIDAVLGAEVVTTDIPSESEATAGLEADVDPVTADSDVMLTDPADGLGL